MVSSIPRSPSGSTNCASLNRVAAASIGNAHNANTLILTSLTDRQSSFVTDGCPKKSFAEFDVFQTAIFHHLPHFGFGKPLLESCSKSVESVCSHRIETAFTVLREWQIPHVKP